MSTLLLSTEPPGPPRKLAVSDLTRSSLTLTWKSPEFDGGSPITGYYVERLHGFSSRWTKVNQTPVKQTTLDVRDLVEFSEYQFRVLAENEAGVGPPSDSTDIVMAKDPYEKPGPITDLTVQEVTKAGALLSWKPPGDDGNSPITNYVVEVRAAGETSWTQVGEKVVRPRYEVRGLREGVETEVRVSAENKVGRGPPSDTVRAKYGE